MRKIRRCSTGKEEDHPHLYTQVFDGLANGKCKFQRFVPVGHINVYVMWQSRIVIHINLPSRRPRRKQLHLSDHRSPARADLFFVHHSRRARRVRSSALPCARAGQRSLRLKLFNDESVMHSDRATKYSMLMSLPRSKRGPESIPSVKTLRALPFGRAYFFLFCNFYRIGAGRRSYNFPLVETNPA